MAGKLIVVTFVITNHCKHLENICHNQSLANIKKRRWSQFHHRHKSFERWSQSQSSPSSSIFLKKWYQVTSGNWRLAWPMIRLIHKCESEGGAVGWMMAPKIWNRATRWFRPATSNPRHRGEALRSPFNGCIIHIVNIAHSTIPSEHYWKIPFVSRWLRVW